MYLVCFSSLTFASYQCSIRRNCCLSCVILCINKIIDYDILQNICICAPKICNYQWKWSVLTDVYINTDHDMKFTWHFIYSYMLNLSWLLWIKLQYIWVKVCYHISPRTALEIWLSIEFSKFDSQREAWFVMKFPLQFIKYIFTSCYISFLFIYLFFSFLFFFSPQIQYWKWQLQWFWGISLLIFPIWMNIWSTKFFFSSETVASYGI